jgi:hypothetical protein
MNATLFRNIRNWLTRKLTKLTYKLNKERLEEEVGLSTLGSYLSYWPDDLSFDEVLEILRNEDHPRSDEVAVWEPLEHRDTETLIEDILSSRSNRLYSLEKGYPF